MKKVIKLALMSLFMSIATISVAVAGNDQIIQFSQLPQQAQVFIKKHFAKYQVSIVKLDKELFSRDYKVIFADGTKLEFDKNGQWKELDGRHSALPLTSIPAAILSHVRKNFPNSKITQIEKTDRGRYAVDLDNSVELIFNSKFEFIGLDD